MQRLAVAHDDAADLKRLEQPFMRIEGYGIGALNPRERASSAR